jgi:hypothetical protein
MVRSHLATHTLLLLHLLTSSILFASVVVVVVVATCYCSSLFFFFLVFSVCFIFVVVGFFQGDFLWEMDGSMMGTLRCCGFEEMIVVL